MKQTISISGMSCNHCVKAVEDEVSELNGVISIKASLSQNNCEVEFDENLISIDEIKNSISEIGYTPS
ncbi:MAG: copper ion binding protein [Clostridiales bacterium]|jgi:copper chaperone|nr:copper ion binding protein [Clostridiales bacterium]